MKMTLHIDDSLLEKAMSLAGVKSNTAAVHLARREFIRRSELVRVLSTGLSKPSPRICAVSEIL